MRGKSIPDKTEKAVSDDFCKIIMQTTVDGFWQISKEGKILNVNEAYVRMSGYSEVELLNMSIFQIEETEKDKEIKNHIKKIIKTGSDRFESLHRKKDGRVINVEVSTTFLPDKNQFIAFIRDITEQKQIQKFEYERTSFLDKIIESSALSMWISDENGTAIRANAACLEFFGAKDNEVIGKYNLFKDSVIEKKGFMPVIREVFEKGKVAEIEIDYDFKAVNHVHVSKATHKIVRSIFTPVVNRSGKVTNVIVQAVDLTDITKTKDALKKTAHDLDERVKELNCLYGISKIVEKEDITLDKILQGTVELVPITWQYPEITCARIIFEQQEYRTANFSESKWLLTQEIIVSGEKAGIIEVYYTEKKPDIDEGPFLKHERILINAIAERLGRIIERIRYREKIKVLEGILPICVSCKKIRNDEGGYEQLESYISKHSEVLFSHSICPDCRKKLYPNFRISKSKLRKK